MRINEDFEPYEAEDEETFNTPGCLPDCDCFACEERDRVADEYDRQYGEGDFDTDDF